MPQLSAIVPAYNQEQHIEECIECIRSQTFENWELIVVDDGSTDATPLLIDNMAQNDGRLSVLHLQNGGAGPARNAGLCQAVGDYVIFIDADDRVEPDYFETVVSAISSAEADVAYFGHLVFDGQGIVRKVNHPLGGRVIEGCDVDKYIVSLYGGDPFETGMPFPIAPWAAVYRNDVIKRSGVHFPAQRQLEDCVFNIRFCRHAQRIATSNYDGYLYRREGQTSLSNWGEADLDEVISCLGSLKSLAQEEPSARRPECIAGANRTVLRWTRLLIGRVIESKASRDEKRRLFLRIARDGLVREANGSVPPSQLPLWERAFRREVLRESYMGTAVISRVRQTALRIVRHER